jgi:hypothetical protein
MFVALESTVPVTLETVRPVIGTPAVGVPVWVFISTLITCIVVASTYRASIFIILLNDNTIVRDRGDSDILEGHVRDGTCSTGNCLDTDTVLRVGDS